MATYTQFYSSVLPGNYALTKSMELTKVQSSGTLWYTKKFLVLYYYVFLSNEIMTQEYVNRVTESFDGYINSLPSDVQDDARGFFIRIILRSTFIPLPSEHSPLSPQKPSLKIKQPAPTTTKRQRRCTFLF